MDYAKSSDARTIYTVDQGRLHESSPDFAPFALSATNTLILLELLQRNEEEIRKAAKKEQSAPVT